jgi:hypothetical protein
VPHHLAAVVDFTNEHISAVPVKCRSGYTAPGGGTGFDGAVFKQVSITVSPQGTDTDAEDIDALIAEAKDAW